MAVDQKPLILFGANRLVSLAAHCIVQDSGRSIVAFTVDAEYAKTESHEGLPLVPFDVLETCYPPEEHEILVPLGYSQMNAIRKARLEQAKEKGYTVASYVSSRASVWADMPIGENVIIFEGAILQSYVRLGDNVTVRSGANIGHHSQVGSHTFIASSAVTGGNVMIGERSWIGLGAVLRDNIRIGERCFIGAGAVVVSDAEADGVYVGVPARRLPNKTSLDVTG